MSSLIAEPQTDKDTVQQLRTCFSVNGSQKLEEAVEYAESLRDPSVKEVALGILLHPLYLPFSKWTHFDRLVSDFASVSEYPDFCRREFAEESQLTRFVCGKSPILTCYKRSIPSKNPEAAEYFFSVRLYDAEPSGGIKLAFRNKDFPCVISLLALGKLFAGYKKTSRAEVVPGTLCVSWPNSDHDLLLMSAAPPDSTQERMQVREYDPKTILSEKPDISQPLVKELTRCTLIETSQFLKRFVEARDSMRLLSCGNVFNEYVSPSNVRVECTLFHRMRCPPPSVSKYHQLYLVDSPDVSCIAIQGNHAQATLCRNYEATMNPDVFMRVQGVWFSCQAMSMKSSSSSLSLDEPLKLTNGTTLNLSKGTFESNGQSYSITKVEPTFDHHGLLADVNGWIFTTLAPALYHPDELDESQAEVARTIGLPMGPVRLIYQYALGGLTLPRGLLASEPAGLFRSMNQCLRLSEITSPSGANW